jgi:2'-5' RNA ligase
MSKTRMFIAVEISPQVRGRAADLMQRLQASEAKVSWVAPENLHLTMKFLGDQTDDELASICRAVQQAVADVPAFEFICHGAGAFPNLQRPRTLWIGVRDGAEQLGQLQRCVEMELARHGFPKEHRGFQPHLTLGRVRSGGAALPVLGQLVAQAEDFAVGVSSVDEVIVFGSFLQRGGPIYEVLARAPLAC